MDSLGDSGLAPWVAPRCPFVIEYSPRVLDDIRLAVVDAFFSLPRGGAEIGGVLWGKHEDGRVQVLDHSPLDCEHAFGPSFTLSPNDHARLAQILSPARTEGAGFEPVGWYHSHTRSDVFLSDVDLEVHKQYFPAPWQIALVMKPSTFNPARAGFFFREADGSVRSASSYVEFVVEPLAVRPIPRQPSLPPQGGARGKGVAPGQEQGAISVTAEVVSDASRPKAAAPVEPIPVAEPEARSVTPPEPPRPEPKFEIAPERPAPPPPTPVSEPEFKPAAPAVEPIRSEAKPEPAAPPPPAVEPERLVETPAPQFALASTGGSRRWPWVSAAALAVLAFAAYQTREGWVRWLPSAAMLSLKPAAGQERKPSPAGPRALPLTTIDLNGQLQVQWDGASVSALGPRNATLEITDGAAKSAIPLDAAGLRAGTFTYARQGERVDLHLTATAADGKQIEQSTTFVGKLPAVKQPADDAQVRKELTALASQSGQLKSELAAAAARAVKAEQALAAMRQERDALAKRAEKLTADLTAQASLAKKAEQPLAALRQERDNLAQQAKKLTSDLAAQTLRALRAEAATDEARKQLQQRRRLENQSPDPL